MASSITTRNQDLPASRLIWTPFLVLCLIGAAAALRRILVLLLPRAGLLPSFTCFQPWPSSLFCPHGSHAAFVRGKIFIEESRLRCSASARLSASPRCC